MTGQPNNIFVFCKKILPGPERIFPERIQEIKPSDLGSNLQTEGDNAINILSVSVAVLFFFLFIWFLSISP
jgi:hypothetical protein